MMIQARIRWVIGCLAVFALSACENNLVPTDETLQITPQSSSYRILSSEDVSSVEVIEELVEGLTGGNALAEVSGE